MGTFQVIFDNLLGSLKCDLAGENTSSMEEVLDLNGKKEPKFKLWELLVPMLVLTLFIWSVILRIYFNHLLSIQDWIAFGLVAISTVFYFNNKKIYVISLFILLIFGALNLFAFTPYHFVVGFAIKISESPIYLGLQPVSLSLLTVHVIIFRKEIEKPFTRSKKQKEDFTRSRIDEFKDRYKDLQVEELKKISSAYGFQDEAIIAAKELLTEKHDQMS